MSIADNNINQNTNRLSIVNDNKDTKNYISRLGKYDNNKNK